MVDIIHEFVAKIDLRKKVTDEFEPFKGSEFIILHKRQQSFVVAILPEFGYIIPDFIIKKINGDTFHLGKKNEKISAGSVLCDDPEILNKEQVTDKVETLLENGYEIVTNPCLSHEDIKFYHSKGVIKITKHT